MPPPTAPSTKPSRRPRRCISSESSGAESMPPVMSSVIGSVARHLFGASTCPASPPRMKVTGSCEPSTTCAATSTQRLRRARIGATSGAAEIDMAPASTVPPPSAC